MEEWKEYKVAEIVEEISMGPFGSNIKVDNFIDFGVPVLNGSNLQGFKLNENSFNYVSKEKADSLGKANACRGDVVITHRGTLGQIIYIPSDSKFERYVISQSQFRLRLKQDIVRPDFFVYFFHTKEGQHRILMNASQVGVPALARPTSTFKNVSIYLPKLDVQNSIMDVLLALDNRIEVNKRINDNFVVKLLVKLFIKWVFYTLINDNLQHQAQALYKSWFVDYEPFKNGEFVESELGMIPKGWRLGTLGEIIEIKYGKDHKKLSDGIIPVYGSGGLMRYAEKPLYEGESVLIPRKGTLNNVMYVNEAFWTVDTMFYTIPRMQNSMLFAYILLSNKDLASMNSGSAVPSMTTEILNNIQIVMPVSDVLAEFNRLVFAYYAQIRHYDQETRRLAQLRDAILPRLMSGELKVDEVTV